MITIYNSTTAPAVMNAHRERLSDFCPTDTGLTCATRIDFHDQPTSILRFVGQHVYESRYRDVEHRFAQPTTRKPFDVQIFNGDKAVSINQLPRFFVMKVSALVADVIVESLEQILQCGIVKLAANSKLTVKYLLLAFSGVDTIAKGLNQDGPILSRARLNR